MSTFPLFGIHEVRLLHADGRIATGYFDNFEAALRAVEHNPEQYKAAYLTLNTLQLPPGVALNPTTLTRASLSAKDGDITHRHWLLVDCDPTRPTKTNSTDGEKAASRLQADAVREYLRGHGWPEPMLCDSANGFHLLYRVNLPNDEPSKEMLKAVLGRLAKLFNTPVSTVDPTNYNASRVCKLYGSFARKGLHSEERPQRRSAVVETPAELVPVSVELLTALAADHIQAEEHKTGVTISDSDVKLQRLIGFLDHYSVEVRKPPRKAKSGYAIGIVCPWVVEHSDESNRDTEVSYIPGMGNGFKCLHAHCIDRHWKEFRSELEKRNPALPPYFGKFRLPKLVHSEIARSFLEENEDFVCVYDQCAETAAWVGTRWAIGDPKDYLLRRALRDYLNKLYPLYPEPENPKSDPRRTLLQSPFLNYVLNEVKPLLPKKSILEFDSDPWLLGLPDGNVVDLKSGEIRPMFREDCITVRITVTPDAAQDTPRWKQFLAEITCDDAPLARYLVQLCGLCLSGHPEQILAVCWGTGRNGKGVLWRLLAKILGSLAITLRPAEIQNSPNNGDASKRTFAKLFGKRLAVINEAPGKRWNYEMLKLLSGGDRLSGAGMRQDDKVQTPTHKTILLTNEQLKVPADAAWKGRLHLIPFLGDFGGAKGDRFIEDKLWAERSGILADLIKGCAEAKHGLEKPPIVTQATDDLMAEMDLGTQFLDDCMDITKEPEDFISREDVERAIQNWLPGMIAGDDLRAEAIKKALKTRFKYAKHRVAGQKNPVWGFEGLKLRKA
jgi:P4 family phage/plasmid primase-like protien